ncbi:hypothetical protein JHK86_001001 [Glycine max]|nr:hypothetical protein JHK86_001001 [Glycine max]
MSNNDKFLALRIRLEFLSFGKLQLDFMSSNVGELREPEMQILFHYSTKMRA